MSTASSTPKQSKRYRFPWAHYPQYLYELPVWRMFMHRTYDMVELWYGPSRDKEQFEEHLTLFLDRILDQIRRNRPTLM